MQGEEGLKYETEREEKSRGDLCRMQEGFRASDFMSVGMSLPLAPDVEEKTKQEKIIKEKLDKIKAMRYTRLKGL